MAKNKIGLICLTTRCVQAR